MSNSSKHSVDDIVKQITSMKKIKSNVLVAIDGPCAGGKTTLASMLKDRVGAEVLHMDDFFLPLDMRTEERYNTLGGNVHHERFLKEVLIPLSENREYIYRAFDCKTMSVNDENIIKPSEVTIIEGSYSCHPTLTKYYDIKIYVDVDDKTQYNRILKRNGQEKINDFLNKWIKLENLYFEAFDIKSKAQIVVK